MSAVDTSQVALQTVLQTAEAAAPAVLAAAATTDPRLSAAVQLAPIAAQALQNAIQDAQAGNMTADQLVARFQQISAAISKTHSDWEALGVPTMPAAPAPAAA
jgi:hypothetical protein